VARVTVSPKSAAPSIAWAIRYRSCNLSAAKTASANVAKVVNATSAVSRVPIRRENGGEFVAGT
jgi:hypothetical protein